MGNVLPMFKQSLLWLKRSVEAEIPLGDEFWNPIIGQTYVKTVPFWETVLGIVLAVALSFGVVWAVAVLLFSLERA